jgi:hypothetical protein
VEAQISIQALASHADSLRPRTTQKRVKNGSK